MENQHRQIEGYRDLSQAEIDLMNTIKAEAQAVGFIIEQMDKMPNIPSGGASADVNAVVISIDKRWLAIGRTQLQQGFMALTRAVAKPTSF